MSIGSVTAVGQARVSLPKLLWAKGFRIKWSLMPRMGEENGTS
jgi:hypothetical protein